MRAVTKHTFMLIVIGVVAPLTTDAWGQNLVTNGGFETPRAGTLGYFHSGSPGLVWTVEWEDGTLGIMEIQGIWTPYQGKQYVELDTHYRPGPTENNNIKIWQELDTIPGGVYELTFAWSPRPQVEAQSMKLAVYWNGNLQGSYAGYYVESDTQWTTESITVVASGNDVVSFREIGVGDCTGMFLDAVSVELLYGSLPVPVIKGPNPVEATSPAGAEVTLDGSDSYDPDEDYPLSYAWFDDEWNLYGINPTVTLSLPLGDNVISLIVWDAAGKGDVATSVVQVVDTTPPTIACPDPTSLHAQTVDGIPATDAAIQAFLAGATATDLCDPAPVITHDAPSDFFPMGVTVVTFTATDACGNSATGQSTVDVVQPPPTEATVDIKPETLNLKSQGRWVTCFIELPEPHDVDDIDVGSLLLNGFVAASTKPTSIDDYDYDGIPDRMVKFPRDELIAILDVGEEVAITVTGIVDDEDFLGTDTIRAINPGIGPKTATVGQPLEFAATIIAEGLTSTVTYTAENLPPGSILDPSTGRFRWTATSDQVGIYPNVTLRVTDGLDEVIDTITITVVEAFTGLRPEAWRLYR